MFPYTKAQLKSMRTEALNDLVSFAGGRTHLAKMLGKPLPTINSWIDRGMISTYGAVAVSNHSALCEQFPLERMRPGL
tara:strand:+ start:1278 stop:1511 length:234 start_codon:yes stop_codon:yes gene_type:complete